MNTSTRHADPDKDRLFRVFNDVQAGLIMHAHVAEQVSFPKQVQFYQMSHDIGDAAPANNNQTLFKKKAAAFPDNGNMFASAPKAEEHITKLNLIRDMQKEQFRSTVMIMTAVTPAY